MNEENTVCWVDIPVIDLDRAIAFYAAILNKNVQKITDHDMSFGLLPHTENNVSACLTVMENRKPSQDGPLVYLNLDNEIDHAIGCVVKQGGEIIKEKEQIGPYGYRAIILDSEGNGVALYSKKE